MSVIAIGTIESLIFEPDLSRFYDLQGGPVKAANPEMIPSNERF